MKALFEPVETGGMMLPEHGCKIEVRTWNETGGVGPQCTQGHSLDRELNATFRNHPSSHIHPMGTQRNASETCNDSLSLGESMGQRGQERRGS